MPKKRNKLLELSLFRLKKPHLPELIISGIGRLLATHY